MAEGLSHDDAPAVDPAVIRALSRPIFARWVFAAAVDWAVIAIVFAAVRRIDHPVAYALAVFPLGSRQQALGALFHDAAHRLASRHRALNDLAGNALSAFPLGLTLDGYRRYHLAHHRTLGTEADPEITHKRTLRHWDLPARPVSVVAHFASDMVGAGVPHLLAAGGLTRPVHLRDVVGLALQWTLALFVAWRCHALWVPVLWVASIVTVFWSGVRLRIWTEHLGTRDTHRIAVPWWFAHFLFPHRIGHHWEHHHWPSVPFWNLGRLRAALPPGREGAPPIVSLSALARAFVRSSPLASGTLGATVGRTLDAPHSRVTPWLQHVALPLVAGVAVYVTCRRAPPGVLSSLPLHGVFARHGAPIAGIVPDALWAYALCAFQMLVWGRDRSWSARAWIASAPVAVVAWELAQRAHRVPGTFDPLDLVVGLMACAVAVVACAPRDPAPPV